MKGLESEIAKKSSSISELKVQLKEANEKQHATQITVNQLQEQVRPPICIIKHCVIQAEIH